MSAVEVRGVSHHCRSTALDGVSLDAEAANCSPWADRLGIRGRAWSISSPGRRAGGSARSSTASPRRSALDAAVVVPQQHGLCADSARRRGLRFSGASLAYDTGPRRGGSVRWGRWASQRWRTAWSRRSPRRAAAGRGRSRTRGRPPGAGPRRAVVPPGRGTPRGRGGASRAAAAAGSNPCSPPRPDAPRGGGPHRGRLADGRVVG